MNEKLKKIRDGSIKGHSNSATFRGSYTNGWDDAETHIRQDEREKILDLVEEIWNLDLRRIMEKVLKKMDEAGE